MTLLFFLQLRKPLVEKLRRERINSSIEQLKSLLGPEFLKQQPDSKLEKADILEMTVCFLTQLPASPKTRVQSTAPSGGRGRHLQTGVTTRQTEMTMLVKDY
uniref:Transcription factor HES-5 n=1 Tax=Lates calcarifer TaxID=8187 RepID=A0A4W6EI37_LATCA